MKAFKFFGLGVATLVVGLGMSGAPREAEACCGDGAIAAQGANAAGMAVSSAVSTATSTRKNSRSFRSASASFAAAAGSERRSPKLCRRSAISG